MSKRQSDIKAPRRLHGLLDISSCHAFSDSHFPDTCLRHVAGFNQPDAHIGENIGSPVFEIVEYHDCRLQFNHSITGTDNRCQADNRENITY